MHDCRGAHLVALLDVALLQGAACSQAAQMSCQAMQMTSRALCTKGCAGDALPTAAPKENPALGKNESSVAAVRPW